MTEPTDSEIVDVVKLWSEAAGLWVDPGEHPPPGWCVGSTESGLVVGGPVYGQRVEPEVAGVRRTEVRPAWHPDVDTALVWSLAVISGRTVDVGRCSTCKGSGFEEREVVSSANAFRAQVSGWTCIGGTFATDPGEASTKIYRRRCPSCTGTGRDTREASRLVLDVHQEWCSNTTDDTRGRALAERLSCFADVLQFEDADAPDYNLENYRLGQVLSLWLGEHEGWRAIALAGVRAAWERLTIRCPRCRGFGGSTSLDEDGVEVAMGQGFGGVLCPRCGGRGRLAPQDVFRMVIAAIDFGAGGGTERDREHLLRQRWSLVRVPDRRAREDGEAVVYTWEVEIEGSHWGVTSAVKSLLGQPDLAIEKATIRRDDAPV